MANLSNVLKIANSSVENLPSKSAVNEYITTYHTNLFHQKSFNSIVKLISLIALRCIVILYAAPYIISGVIAYNVIVGGIKLMHAINFKQLTTKELSPIFCHCFAIIYDYSVLMFLQSLPIVIVCGTLTLLPPPTLIKCNQYITSYMKPEGDNTP